MVLAILCQTILLIIKWILTILIPPLAVLVDHGRGLDLDVNITLTIMGYIPGVVHAIWIVFHRQRPVQDEGLTSYPSRRLTTAYRNYTTAYLILMATFVVLGTILVLITGATGANPEGTYYGFFLISFGFLSFISIAFFVWIIWRSHFRKFTRMRNLPSQLATDCCFVISNNNPSFRPMQQADGRQPDTFNRRPLEHVQPSLDDLPPSYASVWETPDGLPSYNSCTLRI